jgi:hypothetical protein
VCVCVCVCGDLSLSVCVWGGGGGEATHMPGKIVFARCYVKAEGE